MASSDPGNSMFNNAQFVKSYATAEKLTGKYGKMLVEESKIDKTPSGQELVVLDEACGTAIISVDLMQLLDETAKDNLTLTCADAADAMVDFVGSRIEASGWKNAKAVKADGTDTKLPSSHFTHIFLNFGPMIFADWRAAMSEIHRMLRPGGMVAMSSWAKVGWVADVREAFATDPEIPALPVDERLRKMFSEDGEWDDAAWIEEVLPSFGFVDVQTKLVPSTSVLSDTAECAHMVKGILSMIMSKYWSEEQRSDFGDRAKAVVTRYMEEKYGDGEIEWQWEAVLTMAKKAA
jgi:ubiquinone/menaquinone biosynthesis C-methylase UbiE